MTAAALPSTPLPPLASWNSGVDRGVQSGIDFYRIDRSLPSDPVGSKDLPIVCYINQFLHNSDTCWPTGLDAVCFPELIGSSLPLLVMMNFRRYQLTLSVVQVCTKYTFFKKESTSMLIAPAVSFIHRLLFPGKNQAISAKQTCAVVFTETRAEKFQLLVYQVSYTIAKNYVLECLSHNYCPRKGAMGSSGLWRFIL